jgi:molybdate transport system regulatory protein
MPLFRYDYKQVTKLPPNKQYFVLPRFRILHGKEIALGPGKADLLHAIGETNSLRLAARQLHMSYMRAWKLLQTMNHCFRKPLAVTIRGGQKGGHTELTVEGKRVLRLYIKMQKLSKRETRRYWQAILNELK